MNYQEIYKTYQELKETLKEKKQALVERQLEKLHSTDENIIVLIEKIKRFDIPSQEFTPQQKQELKALGEEIRELEENNEILIKHSLGVINEMLSGILNIAQGEKHSYDSKGLGHCDSESLDISSISEQA